MKKDNKDIDLSFHKSLTTIKDLVKDEEIGGYFHVVVLKDKDTGKYISVLSKYDTNDWLNLLGFLEVTISELKYRLMLSMFELDTTLQSDKNSANIEDILQSLTKGKNILN